MGGAIAVPQNGVCLRLQSKHKQYIETIISARRVHFLVHSVGRGALNSYIQSRNHIPISMNEHNISTNVQVSHAPSFQLQIKTRYRSLFKKNHPLPQLDQIDFPPSTSSPCPYPFPSHYLPYSPAPDPSYP